MQALCEDNTRLIMSEFAQSDDSNTEPDLVSDVGSEIEVTLDRWSAGQLGLSDLVVAAGVVVGAVVVAWIVRRIRRRMTRHWEGPAEAAGIVVGQLLSVAIYLFATVLVLEILGFSLGPVIILVLIVVLIVVFLRPVVSNLSSGLLLQLGGLFAHGDVIETNGTLGVVDRSGTRTVVVVTRDGRTVHIPNRDVLDQPLVNYSTIGRRRSELILRLAPGADSRATSVRLTASVAALTETLDDPPVEVVMAGFDGAYPLIRVLFWHGCDLRAERTAVDQVSRALADMIDAQALTLTPESIVVLNRAEPVDRRVAE